MSYGRHWSSILFAFVLSACGAHGAATSRVNSPLPWQADNAQPDVFATSWPNGAWKAQSTPAAQAKGGAAWSPWSISNTPTAEPDPVSLCAAPARWVQ